MTGHRGAGLPAERTRTDCLAFRLLKTLKGFPRQLACLLTAVGMLCAATPLGATSYDYDANGRVRGVTNSQGQSATLDFDSRGNLLRISGFSSTQVFIASFTPDNGMAGDLVTIFGQGFGTTVGSNAVKFNGTSALVQSYSATQLVVKVPNGAPAGPGPITVAVSGGSPVTSRDNFTVTSIGDPPVITSLSTSTIQVGSTTPLTINGQNLYPSVGETTVEIDGIFVAPATISNSQITVYVPAYVSSGPVTVTTPFGTTTAATTLLVLPIGIGPSNVNAPKTVTANGLAQTLTLSTSTQTAPVFFQGNVGDFLSLQASAFSNSTASVAFSVYSPTGTLTVNGTVSASSPSIHLPPLYQTGTYSVFFGSTTVSTTFKIALDTDATVTVDALLAKTVRTTVAAQSQRIIFTANAGDDLGVGISSLAWTNNTTNTGNLSAYNVGAGDMQLSLPCIPPTCLLNLTNVYLTGTYSIVLYPPDATTTMSYSLRVTHDLVTPLPTNGTATPMNLSKVGQNGWYTFDGQAGQKLALQLSGISITPAANNYLAVSLSDPTWQHVDFDDTLGSTASGYTANMTLPTTGTYHIFIDPTSGNLQNSLPTSANLSAQLVLDPLAVAVPVDTGTATVATTLGGQTGFFTFAAIAGDNLGLGLSSWVVNGNTSSTIFFDVFRADHLTLWQSFSCPVGFATCGANLQAIPATETYWVKVRPSDYTVSMSFTATLSHDAVIPALSPNTATPVNLSRSGQNGWLSFSISTAQANQQATLQLTSIVTTPSITPMPGMALTFYKPDGTVLTTTGNGAIGTDGFYWTFVPPVAGTYKVFIDPVRGAAASMNATLVPGQSNTIVVDQSPLNLSTTAGTPSVSFTFSASQHNNLGLGISNLVNSYGAVRVTVSKPDASLLGSPVTCVVSDGGCDVNLPDLPANGTYKVTVSHDPGDSSGSAMSFTATLSTDLSGTLGSSATTFTIGRSGQNARLTFSGAAGQYLGIQIAAISTNPVEYVRFSVLDPSNNVIAGPISANPGVTIPLSNLPAAGQYTLLVDPIVGATASFQAAAVAASSVTVAVDGSSFSQTTTQSGQNVYFTFSPSAGDIIGVGFSNLTVSTNFVVYGPTGAQVSSFSCTTPPICSFTMGTALASGNFSGAAVTAGTYSVVASPGSGTGTMGLTATVSRALKPTVALNSTQTINITRSGQPVLGSFTATAGQTLAFVISGVTTTPSGGGVVVALWGPGNSFIDQRVITSSYQFNITAQAGTYQFFATMNGATGSFSANLH